MKEYKVKQNFSIGKDTYDVYDGEKKIFSVKGKMIELMGKSFDVSDESGDEKKLSGGMSKNSWELKDKDDKVIARYNFSSWGRSVKASLGEIQLEGKVARRKSRVELKDKEGQTQLAVYKTFGFTDQFSVEASDDLDPCAATMLAVALDQKYFEGRDQTEKIGNSLFSSILSRIFR